MIELGRTNLLPIEKETRVGLYLADQENNSILLPNKYVPETYELGEELEVFCYLDNEERPVATTLRPFVYRDEYAFLQVAEVNEVGAFLDWGLEKHLLLPFREQRIPVKAGQWCVIFCYLDPKSSRLVASTRLNRFLDNSELDLRRGDEVSLMVSRQTEIGWEVIVNGRHKGLVYANEVYRKLTIGDKLIGYVKKVREDNKLDISLELSGHRKLEPSAQIVLDKLEENSGVLKLHDRSDPQEIRDQLQMSKKTFKKAIGVLYKARKITIKPDGIYTN